MDLWLIISLVFSFLLGYAVNVRSSYTRGYLKGIEEAAAEMAEQISTYYYLVKKEDIDNGDS